MSLIPALIGDWPGLPSESQVCMNHSVIHCVKYINKQISSQINRCCLSRLVMMENKPSYKSTLK